MSLAISTSGLAGPSGLFRAYQPPAGVYDEVFSAPGVVRPHWQRFVAALDALSPDELASRWEQARRMVRENGVTYNVHGDPEGRDRPWELDGLPLLLPHGEWSSLATALAQRARLLDLVLADVYGPQRLLHEGWLPPELVFAHPGFLRGSHGAPVPQGRHLHFYAAHLARSPKGRWWVLADRSQAPSGAGYAVENRLVISRTLPGLFHDCQVQRLASFFLALRETLHTMAGEKWEHPRIVLLSPGPASPTYFEDAYLARYLGYTLVESGDLTVRGGRLFLKTLGGLIPVDVVLRRVRDEDCDPLELRADSLSGVPGLVQAARGGHVAVTNPIGSGWLETPALMAFLPGLAKRLLGEDLLLPSVATWWCGQERERKYVLERLDQFVIKPAFPRPGEGSIFGQLLSREERLALAERIKARPREYVAQEVVLRSTAPVWTGGGLTPARVALRTFVAAIGDTYQVMPGALSRVSFSADPLGESMLAGEGSKDVWVLSDGPVAPVSLLHPAGTPIPLRRSGNDLPSRVADNLFWLGRHVERAEGAVRLLRSIVARLTSEAEPEALAELPVLLRALADQGQLGPEFSRPDAPLAAPRVEREILSFIFDAAQQGSLRDTLNSIRRVASIVRDRISLDAWRVLNRLDLDLAPSYPLGVVQLGGVLSMLNLMILDLSAFSGLGMESMTRGPGWRFLDMGRRLERAMHTLGLLRAALAEPDADAVIEAVLEIADSSMTYRSRYLTTLQAAPLVDLLLTDETNPRSVAFQLAALATHVEDLPRDESQPLLSAEQRGMLSALTSVRLADVQTLTTRDADGTRRTLERLLARLVGQMRGLSETITHAFLVHVGPTRQMGFIEPTPATASAPRSPPSPGRRPEETSPDTAAEGGPP